jgi:transposase
VPHKKFTQYPEATQREAAARFHAGESTQALVKAYYCHKNSIMLWARKYPPTDATPAPVGRKHHSSEARAQALHRLRAGESADALAAELGVATSTIVTWAKSLEPAGAVVATAVKADRANGAAPTVRAGLERAIKELKEAHIKELNGDEDAVAIAAAGTVIRLKRLVSRLPRE